MSRYFAHDTDFVIGFSPYEIPLPKSIIHHFQAIDSLSLAALAAGSTGWNSPATCNGRNLAYRKSLFQKVDGFSSIDRFESGDDDLFLNVIKQKTDAKISYALVPDLIVPTKMLNSFQHFFYQRIRHASKGLHYGWKKTSLFTILYLYNVALFVGAPIALFQNQLLQYGFLLFLKWLGEFIILTIFALQMKRLNYLKIFPLAALFHIPYVVIFGILGTFFKFQWKKD